MTRGTAPISIDRESHAFYLEEPTLQPSSKTAPREVFRESVFNRNKLGTNIECWRSIAGAVPGFR